MKFIFSNDAENILKEENVYLFDGTLLKTENK